VNIIYAYERNNILRTQTEETIDVFNFLKKKIKK